MSPQWYGFGNTAVVLATSISLQSGLIYLADVVHSDRNADERTNGDKELADGEHNPVEPMLERRSDKSETDWHQDEVCGPEGVKAELRLPDAMVTTS